MYQIEKYKLFALARGLLFGMRGKEIVMRYHETIHLRSSDSDLITRITELIASIRRIILSADQDQWDMGKRRYVLLECFKNPNMDRDFVVHLAWEYRFGFSGSSKSEAGMNLGYSLKEMGLVNHSLWVEMELEENGT